MQFGLQRLLGSWLWENYDGSKSKASLWWRESTNIFDSAIIVFSILIIQPLQKVFDIIHPSRRNLTAIRGYARLGGLPDDPRTDPQDRSWFGPHDRLFTEEEGQPLNFVPGPENG